MDHNGWYSQQTAHFHQPPNRPLITDTVQDSHRLLALYPIASAMPSTHVARHLGNLSIGAAAPSYFQPDLYNQPYPQGNPPPYTEYAHELNFVTSSQAPPPSQYRADTINQAVTMLGHGIGPSYSRYPHPSMLGSQPSSYRPSQFAENVIQLSVPASSYHTPPPGIANTSSSLAFALGEPPSTPTSTVYQPASSTAFFDDFVAQKKRGKDVFSTVPKETQATPHRQTGQLPSESPDPLSLKPTVSASPSQIPRKRKVFVEIESPAKRFQATRLDSTMSQSASRTTPSVSPSKPSLKRTATAYVEVPPAPWLTPTSSRKSINISSSRTSSKGDLGGYGSDYSPIKRDHLIKSSRRTGDRDERGPLEKLTALLEEIFEAEDALLPDIDTSELPTLFSPLTTDPSAPLVHPDVIRKLTKYIGQVTRPNKRIRLSAREGGTGSHGTPRSTGRMADVDTNMLSRALKILERSVRAGEDLDPFPMLQPIARDKTASPRKSGSRKSAKAPTKSAIADDADTMARSPKDEMGDVDTEGQSPEPTSDQFDKLTKLLDVARDSILSADCCIALLGSDRLTKQLYSEELITTCLGTVKNQLTKIVYPFVEASADASIRINPLLQRLVDTTSATSSSHRHQLNEIFHSLSSVLPRINNLVCASTVAMSDSIIIQAIYIAIGPFFVNDPRVDSDVKAKKDNAVLSTLGKSSMRGLRLDALSLIRNIFANHESQRSWIIEEILSSLIQLSDSKQKAGQFRLRDGRSIRTVSALLLQLVQTSAHDVRVEASRIAKERQQLMTLRRQESLNEQDHSSGSFLDELDHRDIRLYATGLESATKAAKTIVLFLTQRSGKGKQTRNSSEAEYRIIFDNLISDLLVVLFWPEWPAANLLLGIACKYMVSSLDDIKAAHQSDNNASKAIALDHLGVIAARIRSSTLKIEKCVKGSTHEKTMDEILLGADSKELEKLLSIHHSILSHLSKRSSEDQAYDSARELTAAVLGQELAAALKQVDNWLSEPNNTHFSQQRLRSFGSQIKIALRDAWKEPVADVFDIGSQEEVLRIDRLAERLGAIQCFKSSFHPILNVILLSLDAPPVFIRTKALRALGQIVMSDPSILSAPNVRRAIENHLLDSSPAVRDAAVELIGKYMIDSPEVAGDYYQKIADRIADTGIGVRKRVIKLLKNFFSVSEDVKHRIDIGTRLVLRMLDEDETVRDLAMKTVEELWFQSATIPAANQKPAISGLTAGCSDKGSLLAKVSIIMGVAANFKDRQSPLEDMLRKIISGKDDKEAVALHARYAEVCETLIDGLVDASDLPGFTVVNCIRTIYLFTSAHPAVLSGPNASTLLPYLKVATTPEEQNISDYLLKVFRISIPHLPKTAAKFGHELQLVLQPMIIKPSTSGGILALQETVACMCAIVQNITHDFVRLVALLKSCNGRLHQAMNRPASQEMQANEMKALSVLIFIVALLGEHCNFDRLRAEVPELEADLNSISKGSITEHIYHILLNLYEKFDDPSLRGRILQSLGFLFRAQPTLMTLERSSGIMDAIFTSHNQDQKARLLKIFQDFMESEATKHAITEKDAKSTTKNTGVHMGELVGNINEFADSGVSSAVMQRYLNPILEATLSQNPQIQGAAIDVLSHIVRQGLAHPLQSFPVIVALETSPNTTVSSRASSLHSMLHSKHASLLNTRFVLSGRASFDYQKKLNGQAAQGYRMQPDPTALLQRWYSLVREKRPSRQDFLKSLVKVFDLNASLHSTQEDVDFSRYMAENFSAFDYKTQEEVFTVIKYLTSILSTSGMQIVEILSPMQLLDQLHGQTSAPEFASASTGSSTRKAEESHTHLIRCSVIIGMLMVLKTHLKLLYGLSEDKCSKFSLHKKSAIGDKPVSKRHQEPISWNRLTFANKPLITEDDLTIHKNEFLSIWNEDGVVAEPEDELS